MTARRSLGSVAALALVAAALTGAAAQATTFDNRDAWTGHFSDFALVGGSFVDPNDEESRAVAWLVVQRGIVAHAGYEGQSTIHNGHPLEAGALMLWCPSPDLCLRRTPTVDSFTVSDDGSASMVAQDQSLGAIVFRWQPIGKPFNGIFLGCESWILGGGWFVEWDVSLHGATDAGSRATVAGSIGRLHLVEEECLPITARDKIGKVELAWSNQGRMI